MTAYTVVTDCGAALGPLLGYLIYALYGTEIEFLCAAVLMFFISIGWWIQHIKRLGRLSS
jgi:hypothetical protein